ncbi:MAG: hypothetical protein JWL61_840 [Gemmatimonadetes bacterium]|nr:hypothetical protein [Gemmatimonadota bacterium]
MLRFVCIGVLALGGVACGATCTLIGCDSGLTIQFATVPTAPIHIDATSADGGNRTYDCEKNTGCGIPTILKDYVPQNVTLTVTYQGRTTTTTVRPSYNESTPNGSGCGPACRSATIPLSLP